MLSNILKLFKITKRTEDPQNSSNQILIDSQEPQIASLPDELIIEIFSKLHDIEDLQSCMLACKRFRNLILKSQKIMKNVLITFESEAKLDEILDFLNIFGGSIKSLKINNSQFLTFILKSVPNLEELKFSMKEKLPINPSSFSLPNLKTLSLTGKISSFISHAKVVNHLKTLKIINYDYNDSEFLTNFVAQQENLEELSIYDYESSGHSALFPTRDISQDCKLSKFLNISHFCRGYNENFPTFLASQLDTLEELNLFGVLSPEILEIIFKNGNKKLKKLILSLNFQSFELCQFDEPHWVLPTVQQYSTHNASALEFHRTLKRFPNLNSLRFSRLSDVTATLPQIESFYLVNLYCDKLLDLKMPNLKLLTVQHLDENGIEEFSHNIPNLEIFAFDQHFLKNDLSFLRHFKNLKRFEFHFGSPSLLRILVNYSEKIVYSDRICSKNLVNYRRNFVDFKFVQKRFIKSVG
ncbi:hypothetical protein ACKWTF_014725 [Chironomus riparius]